RLAVTGGLGLRRLSGLPRLSWLGSLLRVAVTSGLRVSGMRLCGLCGLRSLSRVDRCGLPALLRRLCGLLSRVAGRLSRVARLLRRVARLLGRAERALRRGLVPGLPGLRRGGRLR
ncbi:hypothetical protein, partial [Streptomyces sp. NRRL S-481]|uniref:hypothetical protein n=1 Tax=Streptomyces sp. NRRL S-481 TaxID=1463911 RepID=UPI00056D074F